MIRFAANLTLLYNEHAFLDRFAAAAADGFTAVEFLFPYEHPPEAIAAKLREHALQLVLLNAPPGNWDAAERGLACLPGREAEFRASVDEAIRYARALGSPRIHVMSGVLPPGTEREDVTPLWLDNLRWACERAADLRICIEPLNGRDMPGYFLHRHQQALALIHAVGAANLGLQMDWYHYQISEGDLSAKLRRAFADGVLEHIQLAGVPDRHEPDEGELRVEHLLALLDELGYAGHVGCEYRPRAGTSEGLSWLSRWR
ncbi:2-oxo-tetronate isomerase [Pelomonas sp. KK5]|uniref:2-oxo-tetronate isomerase n=1 Tax=Pelomonas sp. KK5 TaxID=1855730 RepID=UPI00097BC746|nr:2-oxo-tetronate isomerase [Pelomonas sp. KK5]